MAELYSVEQVADLLGLHVRTVRNYVRDGKLPAVRIGKQYRIARADVEALTGGRLAAEPARHRHVEVSSVVGIDAIDRTEAERVVTMVMASVGSRRGEGDPVRVESAYDERAGRLRLVVLAGPADTAEVLRLVDMVTGEGD